jgi:hypothetical protein
MSRRAASISVAMFASLNAIAWCMTIGLPNERAFSEERWGTLSFRWCHDELTRPE